VIETPKQDKLVHPLGHIKENKCVDGKDFIKSKVTMTGKNVKVVHPARPSLSLPANAPLDISRITYDAEEVL